MYRCRGSYRACIVGLMGFVSLVCHASEHDRVSGNDRASEHDWNIGLRSRVAYLEDGSNAGKAGTVRLRTDWQAEWTDHWKSQLELDIVQGFWRSDFSDGVHFNGEPMMPDPEGVDLNQLWLSYDHGTFEATVGRQVINKDDERFIGSTSFWQNEQSFDAAELILPFFSSSSVSVAYLDRALRIFGADAGPELHTSDLNYEALDGQRPLARLGEHDLTTYLLDVELSEWDYNVVKLFHYNYDNLTHTKISNITTGARHQFNYRFSGLRFESELVGALQERTEIVDEPDTHYYLIKSTLAKSSLSVTAQYEKLSSTDIDGGAVSFITPLASLHEHQGWADVFTTTPAQGITDGSVAVQWKASPWRIKAIYHGFWDGNADHKYGRELDLDIIYKPSKQHMIHLRAADFSVSNTFKTQFEDRVRVFLTYSFLLSV